MEKHSDHIKRLKKEVEEKLFWGTARQWHSSMFDELSTKIFEECQVMLSSATLKRFFGVVKHEGNPSITTLDTLSSFVGKQNWREFKTYNKDHSSISFPKIHPKSLYIFIGFVLAMVTIMMVGNKEPEIIINSSEFSFSSRKVGTSYPNSVVFDFNIPKTIRTDSFHIQQYWDRTKTIAIKKHQTQATGIYYFPGYFNAKLMVDGNLVKQHDLFLKSEGWMGTIDYEPVPKYFEPVPINKTGLSTPLEIIEEIKASKDPLMSVFHFIDSLGNISGDDFTFSANVQNLYNEKWAVCQRLQIYFIGTKGAVIIPFSKIGCSSDNNLKLNDLYFNGKEKDLSAFSTDISIPTEIEIIVKNKEMDVFIQNQKVFTQSYTETMGNLVGVRFKFLGMGQVNQMSLLDQLDQKVDLFFKNEKQEF